MLFSPDGYELVFKDLILIRFSISIQLFAEDVPLGGVSGGQEKSFAKHIPDKIELPWLPEDRFSEPQSGNQHRWFIVEWRYMRKKKAEHRHWI